MNRLWLAGIVVTVGVGCGALVLRAGAQSAPAEVAAPTNVGKTVMRMHCASCRVVRPETIEAPVVLDPRRYWRGPLPIPAGYTHWVPPVDDYARYAPDPVQIPLPEILRGSRAAREASQAADARYQRDLAGFAASGGFGSEVGKPGSMGDVWADVRRGQQKLEDEKKARDLDRMLDDYRNKKK